MKSIWEVAEAFIKPQMQPPRSTPKTAGPPEKRVDPATEFLRSQGALGGLKGPGSGIPPKSAQMSSGGAQKPPAQVTKPSYKGHYVGQSVNTGGTYQHKPVSWTDKNDPETKKYGQVQSKVDTRAVWNGNDWVSPQEFSKTGKKENTDMGATYTLKEFFLHEIGDNFDDDLGPMPGSKKSPADGAAAGGEAQAEEFYDSSHDPYYKALGQAAFAAQQRDKAKDEDDKSFWRDKRRDLAKEVDKLAQKFGLETMTQLHQQAD